jgi:hypothetical protein
MDFHILAGPNRTVLHVRSTSSVSDVKSEIEKQLEIPTSQQKIIHRGKTLSSDTLTLSDYGFRNNDKVMVRH